MSNPFVWFDNRSARGDETAKFYSDLFGWGAGEGPGMTMLNGEDGPFAGVMDDTSPINGWIPFVEVSDLEKSEGQATQAGGAIAQARTDGPAGTYTIVRDPGDAHFALWKRG